MIDENTLKITFIGEDKGVGSMLDGVKNALGGVMTVAGGIISAHIFTQIGNQIKNMAVDGFEAVRSAEQLSMQLETLVAVELKNSGAAVDMSQAYSLATDKASELHKWIKNLAMISPYDTMGVQKAFAQAMTYGLVSDEAKKLTESTLNWGSATLKTNAEIQDFMFVLSQMNSVGEVTSMDLKQLASRGLDLNLMAKELGVTVAGLNDVAPMDLIHAFEAISSSTYAGGLERASLSLDGIVGFFKEFKDDALKSVFTEAIDAIKPKLLEFEGILMSDGVQNGLKNFGDGLGVISEKIVSFGSDFFGAISNVKDILTDITNGKYSEAFMELNSYFDPTTSQKIINFVADIKTASTQIKFIGEDLINGNYERAFSRLTQVFSSEESAKIINFVQNIKDLKDDISGFLKMMGSEGGRTINLRKLVGFDNANEIIKTINEIKQTFEDVWPKVEAAFTRAWIIIEPKWDKFVKSMGELDLDHLMSIVGFLSTVIEVLANTIILALGIITSIVTPILAVIDLYKNFMDTFLLDIKLLLDGITLVVSGFFELIEGLTTLNVEKIIEGLAKMGLGFGTIIVGILKTFSDGITKTFDIIKKFLTEQLKAFERFFFGEASDIGTFFIDGLINGIFGGMPRLVSAIQGILNAFKSTDLSSSSNSYDNGGSGGIGVNYTPNGTGQNGYTSSSNINNNSNSSFNLNIANFNGTPQDLYQTGKIVYQLGADNGWTK